MKKKGFTLVELLAVIAILGTIAVIIIPAITKTITRAEKETFEAKVRGVIRSSNYEFKRLEMLGATDQEIVFTFENGEETSNVVGAKLEYDGKPIQNGIVKINEDGKVSLAIYNDEWCAIKKFNSNEITITEFSAEENCQAQSLTDISGANKPELSEGMIPITWDGTNWVKASNWDDPYEQNWHDYNAKEWANVVLVTEASRNTYKSAAAGTPILESDILAYLVWIPRYRYKLFNVDALAIPAQTIEIEFESVSTSKSKGSTNGMWLTHPAFTFGNTEQKGFWVAKFETTGNETLPTVKPNITSLHSQKISTQFATAKKFNTTTTYGLTSEVDAHMMKSMDWGAVAYLSQSIYGKNSEVWINPSSSYITGCAGTSASVSSSSGCSHNYTSVNGQKASTTGNIYGIYDMRGGVWEYVMGGMYNSDGTTIKLSSSEFDQATIDSENMEKYINKYAYGTTYNDQTAYDRRQLGDAIGETRGWYGDGTLFAYSSSPWFTRGGGFNHGTSTGLFNFSTFYGTASNYHSFRLVVFRA